MSKNPTVKVDIHEQITARIIEHLEKNILDHLAMWEGVDLSFPQNIATKNKYKGINVPLLWSEAMSKGYAQNLWIGYGQAIKLGGHVKKGEKGTPIIKVLQLPRNEAQTPEEQEFFMRISLKYVYNVAQCEGLDLSAWQDHAPTVAPEFSPIAQAEALLNASGASITWEGGEAFYSPTQDFIKMPARNRFTCAENAYLVALHELTHWTAHEKRLNRAFALRARFKNADYALEELVAELGAAFLSASLDLRGKMEHHASYIKSWLTVLKNDKRAIFAASTMAQEAHDFIMSKISPSAQAQPELV